MEDEETVRRKVIVDESNYEEAVKGVEKHAYDLLLLFDIFFCEI